MLRDELLSSFGGIIKKAAEVFDENDYKDMYEIRIRNKSPIIFVTSKGEIYITNSLRKTKNINNSLIADRESINKTIELISRYSIYAFEEELKKGFITMKGGHRAGITGRAVIENGIIKTIKGINSINIRISREVKGCSKNIMPYIVSGEKINNTIIISPPNYGKTTVLRDISRNISNGIYGAKEGFNICIIDERNEIGGGFMGEYRNDVGMRTDILDSCPKAYGMEMALRSMSPDVIIVDEIGREDDVKALMEVFNSGVSVICTIHGSNIDDIKNKIIIKKLTEYEWFDRYIILGKRAETFLVYDKHKNLIYKE